MQTSSVPELVAAYLRDVEPMYCPGERANIRTSLARLVVCTPTLDLAHLRAAVRVLEVDTQRSASYRRGQLARWRRFLAWIAESNSGAFTASELGAASLWRLRFLPGPPATAAPWRPDELRAAVLSTMPRLTPDARDAVVLLAFTGARPAEILSLRSSDITSSPDEIVARVQRHKTSHLDPRPRQIILPPPTWSIIARRHRPLCPLDYLFPSPADPTRHRSTQAIAQTLRRAQSLSWFEKICGAAPRRRWRLYDLRRMVAQTIRRELTLDHAQAVLGHRSRSTTEIYAHLDDEDLARRAAQVLADAGLIQ